MGLFSIKLTLAFGVHIYVELKLIRLAIKWSQKASRCVF